MVVAAQVNGQCARQTILVAAGTVKRMSLASRTHYSTFRIFPLTFILFRMRISSRCWDSTCICCCPSYSFILRCLEHNDGYSSLGVWKVRRYAAATRHRLGPEHIFSFICKSFYYLPCSYRIIDKKCFDSSPYSRTSTSDCGSEEPQQQRHPSMAYSFSIDCTRLETPRWTWWSFSSGNPCDFNLKSMLKGEPRTVARAMYFFHRLPRKTFIIDSAYSKPWFLSKSQFLRL